MGRRPKLKLPKRTHIILPEDTYNKVKALADKEERSISYIVTKMIDNAVTKRRPLV